MMVIEQTSCCDSCVAVCLAGSLNGASYSDDVKFCFENPPESFGFFNFKSWFTFLWPEACGLALEDQVYCPATAALWGRR